MVRRNSLALLSLVISLAGCRSGGGGRDGGPSSGAAFCAGGRLDLSKISGDWLATAPIDQPDGKIPGSQYRLRLQPPDADGTVKGWLAWRMDTKPFTGTLEKNALGYRVKMLEDMSDEVIARLKAANNRDPNVYMRAAITLTAAESGCVLEVLDNFQSFVGDRAIENTSLGLLKLVPYTGTAPMSFARCTAPKTIYFDGRAEDETGAPRVPVTADKPVKIRSEADASQMPAGCALYGEVYVDGSRVKERVDGAAQKSGSVDVIAFETEITVPQGPTHPVELHVYGECGETKEKRFIASLCNFAATR